MLCRVALPRKLQARYVMTTINLRIIRSVKRILVTPTTEPVIMHSQTLLPLAE
jgi:hypothetical protein